MPDEPLIGVTELADFLGVPVSTVRKWCMWGPDSGKIPRFHKIGGHVKFAPADIRAWLDTKAVS